MATKVARIEQTLARAFDQKYDASKAEWSVSIGVTVNAPIVNGPERLPHVSNFRLSGRRVTSPLTAINFAEPDPVQIGHVAGSSSTSPQ